MHSGISCCSKEHLIECLTYLWDFRSTEGTCALLIQSDSPHDSDQGCPAQDGAEELNPCSPSCAETFCMDAEDYLRKVVGNPWSEDLVEMADPLWGPSRCLSFKDWFSWWEDGASWGDYAHQFNDCEDRGVSKTSFLATE
jgi:hypothetical protein